MKHLAKMSGMSLSSVSRALDPARRHLVRPATREKILKYAKEVNFSVNMPARQLRRKQSEVITVVVFQLPNKNKNFSNEFVSPSNGRDIIQKLSYFIKAKNYDMKLEFIAEGEMIPDSNMIFGLRAYQLIIL
ncbi:MAG: LacI family DNA-binding transcriptional regulator [Victivallaceae bacterium]|nr:LacI family DNA-binding transcriptional regulator [Victivallaceae bacterium]